VEDVFLRTLLQLYETSRRRLCIVAARYAARDAEDVVQDAFLAALSSRETFRGKSAPLTWVHRIVVNAAVTNYRKCSRRQSADLFVGDGPRITKSLEDSLAVRRALRELPVQGYRVLVMYELMGHTHQEIAIRLSLPVGTSKWRLAQARGLLQGSLADARFARRPVRRAQRSAASSSSADAHPTRCSSSNR
jgi:RNA polymerase sigma-70 factor, ECF subfamily